jgi:hypothetical protein
MKSFSFEQFEKNINKPVSQLRKMPIEKTIKCVTIDSRDRNRSQFPNSNKFTVHVNPSNTFEGAGLYTNLRNVQSIKLVEAILPSTVLTYAYIVLVIPELEDTMIGTNDLLKKCFAILIPDDNIGSGNFVTTRYNFGYCSKIYDPPKANINRLTFEFYTPSGTLINFGTDTTPPTAPNSNVQATLILQIEMLNASKNQINSRIVY